ncbi:helix-turn-helix transcriptional regulator [Roseomonas aerophila]|uniref:Helix-turn-helix transcriptional regulator n=1 Tax=Teichococcus aerophilus TaxID=1224513 RepID=A0ABR7RRI6_9PROT|nr:AraC family transcriptional regulator [Pseudoroseomonas aerophila]MBC9208948.1 helix-turn-helix transcriptional regulator [Pseudoroseomonas aerophila]
MAVGSYRGFAASHAYARHFHDEIVLGANLVSAEWLKLDGRDLVAEQGDSTLYNPVQVQEGGSLEPDREWRFLTFYIDAGAAHRLLYGTCGCVEFNTAVLSCKQTFDLFLAGERLFLSGNLVELDEVVTLILGQLEARVGTTTGKRKAETSLASAEPRLKRVAERLLERLDEQPDLSDLAGEVGLSVEHLVRSYARAFGLPPLAWAMQKRLARARQLLRDGKAPAHVAAELGFSDQSHLNRFFKRVSGTTPAQFSRAIGQ